MQLTVIMNVEAQLHAILDEYFDEESLKTLAFELGVKYDDLAAQGATNKARELILYLKQRGRLPELAAVIQVARPEIKVPIPKPPPPPPKPKSRRDASTCCSTCRSTSPSSSAARA